MGLESLAPPEEFVLPLEDETHDFRGGSGGLIRRYSMSRRLVFVEREPVYALRDRFVMEARLGNDGQLNFDLFIRQVDESGRKIRHPDFSGADFLHVVIGQVFKGKINSIRGRWDRDSYNHIQFREFMSQGMNQIEAANKTWTGLIAGEHGFKVREDFVLPNFDDHYATHKIEVLFLPEQT